MKYEAFVNLFDKSKPNKNGVMAKCPAHEDGSASLSIGRSSDGGVLLNCFAGCKPENIVSAMGLTMKDLFAKEKPSKLEVFKAVKHEQKQENIKSEIVKIYSYKDSLGRELYQALRLNPKSFRQRHLVSGNWVWDMNGVERVLYHLPDIEKSSAVWIVEGEKDADNLRELGFVATCNVGGAGKWLDGYTTALKDKHVVICGDNDKPGQDHVELVFDSVSSSAKSVKIIKLPTTVKDATDFIETFKDKNDAKTALQDLEQTATPHISGIKMPVYSMADLAPLYKKQIEQSATQKLNLGNWLPSLNKIRPLIPGELCLILGDTGTGKTAMLQNIAVASGLTTLMFEMELPPELMFERFFALKANLSCSEIEKEFKDGADFQHQAIMNVFPDLFICSESKITLDGLESIIMRSDLKIGKKPVLVLIDYVQLIQGRASSRYEKTSDIAEGLKILAKATKTIIVVSSQVARQKEDSEGIGLHSGKDSGSLENSAGLVLGAWRDSDDARLLHMKVLKCTKGGSGLSIEANFTGENMRITERSIHCEDEK